jgi:anti-sigma-K factor RskA
MTMRDHSAIEELLSAEVLGGLDLPGREALYREMDEHGPDCAECRQLRDEYGEVAGRMAFALEPVPIRPELEDETMELARMRGEAVPLRRVRGERVVAGRGRMRPFGILRPLVAAAAAVALFFGGWAARDLIEGGGPPFDVATARVVTFQGEVGDLAVAYLPGRTGAYVFGSNLQAPPSNRVYEVWMFQEGTPLRGACFRPKPGGTSLTYLDADLETAQQMAVTVESPSCPSAPTTQPILTADLT